MSEDTLAITAIIANELKVKESQVSSAIRLLDEGATVPFIARYCKEKTGTLTDVQLRYLAEKVLYLRELYERRAVVLQSIQEQGKLTDALEQAIVCAQTKTRLEDLYLPYRPKRHTKAQLAIDAGLEPLAQALWKDPTLDREEKASEYMNPEQGIDSATAALEGARHILMEHFSQDADLLETLREYLWRHAVLSSTGSSKNKEALSKFSDYFKFSQPLHKIPSHRAQALFRGRRESVLQFTLSLPEQDADYGVRAIAGYFNLEDKQRKSDAWLLETAAMAWKVKLFTKLELELLARLRELADIDAIKVFSKNLRDLLLAAPAGPKVTMGLDPGIRTGVKVAVVNATGKLLDHCVVYPLSPQNEWHQAIASLAKLATKHCVDLISIGNGTGSRETERLVTDLMKMYPDLALTKVTVSEAGASVYSASEIAGREFPDLDVTLRGAVSIARRLQDPLAELVQIEAKSIGVGQYQHDVNQARLARCLDTVVEDCVNAVGVDVNSASAALLSHVSGLSEGLAKNIVQYRDEHGAFANRDQLKNVQRMGDKAFQQAAGFLRIMAGDNPLDSSCVHPSAYVVVEKILKTNDVTISNLIGNKALLHSINASDYTDAEFGLPTVNDIVKELEKPGRDPRPEFKTAQFKEGVEDIASVNVGMLLEGVVSNVTNFGAFVDIGVHQDGLVHISEMTNRFITDPREIVKAGDIIQVRVTAIDTDRKRISLSMKLEETQPTTKAVKAPPAPSSREKTKASVPAPKIAKTPPEARAKAKTVFNTAMADALTKLRRDTTEH